MKNKLILLLLFSLFIFSLSAQEVSEKKDIAIFSLERSSVDIPDRILNLVDTKILEVFVELGRFNVIGITNRLGAEDIDSFIGEIRRYKESRAEIPEEVRLGEVTFTEQDFNRLTGSFVVVIPSVVSYTNNKVDNDTWEANITVSFTFLNVETLETFAFFEFTSTSAEYSREQALLEASGAIPSQLSYEVRSLPEFTLKTGVVEVFPGGTVAFQFGTDMGVVPGDEFYLMRSRVLPTGHTIEEAKGLIKVKDVATDISYGQLLYAEGGRPVVGEQLKELPRIGFDASLYLQGVLNRGSVSVAMVGVRTAVSRGFFGIRPIIGFEVPFGSAIGKLWGLPFNSYIGGERVWYFGRFAFTPSFGVGLSGIIPIWELTENDPEDFVLTHLGALGEVKVSYLINPHVRLFLTGGYALWFNIYGGNKYTYRILGDHYYGVTLGGGVTFKL